MILREDWLPSGWVNLIAEAGLARMILMTGVETSEILPPRRPPAKLELRRVANDAMARDLAELNAHAYHMPAEAFECIANMRLLTALLDTSTANPSPAQLRFLLYMSFAYWERLRSVAC